MRKYLFLLFGLITFLFGCNDGEKSPRNATGVDSAKLKHYEQAVNETLNKMDIPSQMFSAPGNQLSLIRGKKGTVIFLSPNDLETETGEAPGEKIIVELKELTTQSDLAQANAQTSSNGNLLVSGGAYFINMTSHGKVLRLKKDKTLKLAFPKITDSSMVLFYGQRDSQNHMNWLPANEPLTAKNGYSIDTKDTTGSKSIMVYNSKTFKLMGYVGNEATFKRDTGSLTELKRNSKDAEAVSKLRTQLQGHGADSISDNKLKTIIKTAKKLNESLYDISNIHKLGWINCDRLYKEAKRTNITYTIDPKDSISYARIYLVFRELNSLREDVFYNVQASGTRAIEDMPVGNKLRLLAVTKKNDQLLTCLMDLTITNNQHTMIIWKKTTTDELNNYFDVNSSWGIIQK